MSACRGVKSPNPFARCCNCAPRSRHFGVLFWNECECASPQSAPHPPGRDMLGNDGRSDPTSYCWKPVTCECEQALGSQLSVTVSASASTIEFDPIWECTLVAPQDLCCLRQTQVHSRYCIKKTPNRRDPEVSVKIVNYDHGRNTIKSRRRRVPVPPH